MKSIYIVQAGDVFGTIYNLGAFQSEDEAREIVSTLEEYAIYQEQVEEALDNGESLEDIPEPPQIPPQLAETHRGQIDWSDVWVLQLPICKDLSDCDLY